MSDTDVTEKVDQAEVARTFTVGAAVNFVERGITLLGKVVTVFESEKLTIGPPEGQARLRMTKDGGQTWEDTRFQQFTLPFRTYQQTELRLADLKEA